MAGREWIKTVGATVSAAAEAEMRVTESQMEDIRSRLDEQHAVLIAHYYTHPEIQRVAEETGGIVSDSLEMAAFGRASQADTLIVAGVRFMGETAKILSPEKRVLMCDIEATCSLDLGCPPDEFSAFCDKHPDRTVVVYANTSAAVKARADWVVTSSIAVDLIGHLDELGERILWAPDKHLGKWVERRTAADMIMWDGECIVHEEFRGELLDAALALEPDALVIAHPESPAGMLDRAHFVGSTSQLIQAAATMNAPAYIVATERGIFYKMRQQIDPSIRLIPAPTGGEAGAQCRACARCPWMAMNTPRALIDTLSGRAAAREITIPEETARRARRPLDRMLEFREQRLQPVD